MGSQLSQPVLPWFQSLSLVFSLFYKRRLLTSLVDNLQSILNDYCEAYPFSLNSFHSETIQHCQHSCLPIRQWAALPYHLQPACRLAGSSAVKCAAHLYRSTTIDSSSKYFWESRTYP